MSTLTHVKPLAHALAPAAQLALFGGRYTMMMAPLMVLIVIGGIIAITRISQGRSARRRRL